MEQSGLKDRVVPALERGYELADNLETPITKHGMMLYKVATIAPNPIDAKYHLV